MNKKMMIGITILAVIAILLFIIFGTKTRYDVLGADKLDEIIKKRIVIGEEQDIPPEVREKVKKEYLTKCDEISDAQEKIECLEVYYDGENVIEIKEKCKTIVDQQEKDDCMDSYYIAQAQSSSNKVFCETIKNEEEREDCFNYI